MPGQPRKNRQRQEFLENVGKVLGDSPILPDGTKVVDLDDLLARASVEVLGSTKVQQRVLKRVLVGQFPESAAESEGVSGDVFRNVWMDPNNPTFKTFRTHLRIAEGNLQYALLSVVRDPEVSPKYRKDMGALLSLRFPEWNGKFQHAGERDRMLLENERLRAEVSNLNARTGEILAGRSDPNDALVVTVQRRLPADDLTRESLEASRQRVLEEGEDGSDGE